MAVAGRRWNRGGCENWKNGSRIAPLTLIDTSTSQRCLSSAALTASQIFSVMPVISENNGENLLSDSHSQYGTMPVVPPSTTEANDSEGPRSTLPINHNASLRRGLSARQVQMIAIAGTIGTGLFLGTGRSLAQGGPSSMLLCYSIVGFVVYVTLLLLGEMATQYPVAGE